MDGETDVRHATVAFVVLFANAAGAPASAKETDGLAALATENGTKSFVSVMWPGHLGSFSSVLPSRHVQVLLPLLPWLG